MSYDAAQAHKAEVERAKREASAAALQELQNLATKAPAGLGDWSIQRTRQFKSAALAAQRVVAKAGPGRKEIEEALKTLRQFHAPEGALQ